jgi:hypothetical protein
VFGSSPSSSWYWTRENSRFTFFVCAAAFSVWEDETSVGFARNTPAPGNYMDWTEETQIFESVAAVYGRSHNLTAPRASRRDSKAEALVIICSPPSCDPTLASQLLLSLRTASLEGKR